jgi:O6-methylguanine-DNA--protein-cysteine methyltransferase
MPPIRTERTHQRRFDDGGPSEHGRRLQDLLDKQAHRRTVAEERAFHPPGTGFHLPNFSDPRRHSTGLDALTKPTTELPAPQRNTNRPHAGFSALSSQPDKAEAAPPQNYIDLTAEDDAPQEITTPGPCLAYCPHCRPPKHLNTPFDDMYAQCLECYMPYEIRRYPCSCPPPQQCDDERDDGFSDLRATLNATDPPLSNLARRVLLLTAQVPTGRYTTYIALADFYMHTWGMTSRKNMGAALKKNEWWPTVPSHRVIAKNGSIGTRLEWGGHLGDFSTEERMEVLQHEGMRFDVNGRALGSTFTEFK